MQLLLSLQLFMGIKPLSELGRKLPKEETLSSVLEHLQLIWVVYNKLFTEGSKHAWKNLI